MKQLFDALLDWCVCMRLSVIRSSIAPAGGNVVVRTPDGKVYRITIARTA